MKLTALALSIGLVTAVLAAPTTAQEASAEEELRRLVDPRPTPKRNQSRDIFGRPTGAPDLDETISMLLAKADYEPIKLIGPAAVPVLEAITLRASTSELINWSWNQHPLHSLNQISPERGLDFLATMQQEDPERFALLVRSGYAPFSFENEQFHWIYSEEPSRGRVSAMLDRALAGSDFDDDEKLSIACRVYETGLDTGASRALIQRDLDASIEHGLGSRGQREFFWEKPDFDIAGLSEKQSYFLARSSDLKDSIRLLSSPYPRVRVGVLDHLDRQNAPYALCKQGALIGMADQSEELTEPTQRLLGKFVVRAKKGLTRPELLEITRYYARVGVDDDDNATWLQRCISESTRAAHTAEEAAEVAELLGAVYNLPLPNLQDRLDRPLSSHFTAPKVAAASYRRLLDAEYARPMSLHRVVRENAPSGGAALAEFRLDIWTAHKPGADDAELAYKEGDLRHLPKERYGEALRWLGRTGPHFDMACAADVPHWTDGAEALRASAYNEGAPWKERATALMALFSTAEADEKDAARCGHILVKELLDPKRRALFLKLMRMNREESGIELAAQWNGVMVRVYQSEKITGATKEQLPLSYAPTSHGVLQAMLDAVATEIQPYDSFKRFEGLYYMTGSLAARETLTLPHNVLANWLVTEGGSSDLVTYVLKSDLESPRTDYRDLILGAIKTASTNERNGLAAQVLRFPEEDTVPKLIDVATELNSTSLIAIVRDSVRRLLTMRQLKSTWAATEELPTKTAAVVQLLGLIQTGSEVVRLEAMRGLGTLGAVEALPQLIAILESGTEREKARAAEVLLQLNQQAMISVVKPTKPEK